MMKPRTTRVAVSERSTAGAGKTETLANGVSLQRGQSQLSNNQQTSAQAIRKRRSSINVYDQPSSLNSRLRQLETDMLRLDEDRTKLFDDTHSALAQYELRLNEIHAILKSRQDNVEKYVEDMKALLLAKEEFEKQARLLNEKHDRIHEKFMHRETTISREIKLLKNKFEALEKNRQFRSILQKSAGSAITSSFSDNNIEDFSDLNASQEAKSATSEGDSLHLARLRSPSQQAHGSPRDGFKASRAMSRMGWLGKVLAPLSWRHRRSRVSVGGQPGNRLPSVVSEVEPSAANADANQIESYTEKLNQRADGNHQRAIEIEVREQLKNKKKRGLFKRLFG